MCEQCVTSCVVWRDVLPGWTLMRAQKDGNIMEAGQYGLLRCNDPDAVWTGAPQIEPPEGRPSEWGDYVDGIGEFKEALVLRPEVGWELTKAAMERGYSSDEHGLLSFWLWDHLAKCMKQSWPRHHGTNEEVRA